MATAAAAAPSVEDLFLPLCPSDDHEQAKLWYQQTKSAFAIVTEQDPLVAILQQLEHG